MQLLLVLPLQLHLPHSTHATPSCCTHACNLFPFLFSPAVRFVPCYCVQAPVGPAAAAAGVDLACGALAAMDGEKDPRCLLAAFVLLQVGWRGT
jgi:hypothetical protein